MSEWAQYYTPSSASEKLVGMLEEEATKNTINTVFDLGAGQGELLAAAGLRWPDAKLYAVDIDAGNVTAMQTRFPDAHCLASDSMHFDLPKKLGLNEGSADIAVANPPYGKMQLGMNIQKILRQVALDDVISSKRVSREIVFLAQNLRLLRNGGSLVAIVPEGLGSSAHFDKLRAALMERHGLFKAVELPSKTFSGTEAKTLALFMKKGRRSYSLEWISANGDKINLSPIQVGYRLDGNFHRLISNSEITLEDLDVDIRRGNITKGEGKAFENAIFHTTDFRKYTTGPANLPLKKNIVTKHLVAKKGDILLARVGSRCIGQVTMIQSGNAMITDCVYRIRVRAEFQNYVYESLKSSEGYQWLSTVAHGTCAQLISKRDLMKFPLYSYNERL